MPKTCLERTDDLREIVVGLESFNRNVSHDLRNPLACIVGLARLADHSLSGSDTAAVERLLAAIAAQAEAALELVTHCCHWPVPTLFRCPLAAYGWQRL